MKRNVKRIKATNDITQYFESDEGEKLKQEDFRNMITVRQAKRFSKRFPPYH